MNESNTKYHGLCLRAAHPNDVDAMVALKHRLRLGADESGGFLLGAPKATYLALIEHAIVRIAEFSGRIIGFSCALPDTLLRRSEIWERRREIAWENFEPGPFERDTIAFFDQLALLPGFGTRIAGPLLALQTVDILFADHQHLLTTTVLQPVVNRTAWPLLAQVGARQVGSIREYYEEVGTIVSAIFYGHRSEYLQALKRLWRAASPARRRLLESVLIQVPYTGPRTQRV